jgi:hypothetical protein
VKFKIKNTSVKFFFIANISATKNGIPMLTKNYYDNVIASKTSKNWILLIPKSNTREYITLKLLENAGLNRTTEKRQK